MKSPRFLNYTPAVERELFVLGYCNLPVHLIGNTGLSLLVIAGTSLAVSTQRVLGWLAYMLAMSLMLFTGVWDFRKRASLPSINIAVLRQWEFAPLWMVTLPGLWWGSIGVLFVPGAQVNNLIAVPLSWSRGYFANRAVVGEEAGYMVLLKPVNAALLASTLGIVLDRRSVERP